MNNKQTLTRISVHALCIVGIGATFVAAHYLPPQYHPPLFGVATWLWGKYGFVPHSAVINSLLDKLKAEGVISDPPPKLESPPPPPAQPPSEPMG